MFSPNQVTVELNAEQLKVLRTLFSKRVRLFVLAFFGVLVLWLSASIQYLSTWYKVHFVYSKEQFYQDFVAKTDWALISAMILLAGLLVYFGSILWKRIIPLYKDIKYQSGMYVSMEITKKSIPYHNRCFFFFDDLKIPFKEIDHATYYNHMPGDMINVLIGEHSGIHVDEYLNIAVI